MSPLPTQHFLLYPGGVRECDSFGEFLLDRGGYELPFLIPPDYLFPESFCTSSLLRMMEDRQKIRNRENHAFIIFSILSENTKIKITFSIQFPSNSFPIYHFA